MTKKVIGWKVLFEMAWRAIFVVVIGKFRVENGKFRVENGKISGAETVLGVGLNV